MVSDPCEWYLLPREAELECGMLDESTEAALSILNSIILHQCKMKGTLPPICPQAQELANLL